MQDFEITFTPGLSDLRQATWYGLFLRQRRALIALFAVLLGTLVYALAAAAGAGRPNPLVFCLAGAFLVWGLVLFAGAEKQLRAQLRAPGRLVGCEYRATVSRDAIAFQIPARNACARIAWKKLLCAFELHALFLLYVSERDVYLLPKRALSAEQAGAIRARLRETLGERFLSRFRG